MLKVLLTVILVVSFRTKTRCAFLILGPVRISSGNSNALNETERLERGDAVRNVRSHSPLPPTSDEEIEVVENIPCCTNLFTSAGREIDNKCVKKVGWNSSDHKHAVSQIAKSESSEGAFDGENYIRNTAVLIQKLKKLLAQEKNKVHLLKDQLDYFVKLRDAVSADYLDNCYYFEEPYSDRVVEYGRGFDAPNFIAQYLDSYDDEPADNSCKLREGSYKFKAKPVCKMSLAKNFPRTRKKSELTRQQLDDCIETDTNYSGRRGKFNLKPLKTPNTFIGPNTKQFRLNSTFPCNSDDDVQKTLYPQFFKDDRSELYDVEPNFRYENAKLSIDPQQIYMNNMRHLTEPYKKFPGTGGRSSVPLMNRRDRRNHDKLKNLKHNGDKQFVPGNIDRDTESSEDTSENISLMKRLCTDSLEGETDCENPNSNLGLGEYGPISIISSTEQLETPTSSDTPDEILAFKFNGKK